MKVNDIIKKIEDFCPLYLAYDWDNPGLMIGDISCEVNNVYLTLDVTSNTADEAIEKGCSMIISHHPMFFKGIKNINYKTSDGALIKKLIQNNITVYSAHTNMDRAEYGLNYFLAKKVGIIDPLPLNKDNLGKIGEIPEISLKDYAKKISVQLNTKVKVIGDPNKIIRKCAVCSGAGAETIKDAIENCADVLITGDIKYHEALQCIENKFSLIDAGHFGTECFVTDIFENILKDTELNLIKSTVKNNEFYF